MSSKVRICTPRSVPVAEQLDLFDAVVLPAPVTAEAESPAVPCSPPPQVLSDDAQSDHGERPAEAAAEPEAPSTSEGAAKVLDTPPGDLAELLEFVQARFGKAGKGANLASAIRLVGRALGADLAQIPTEPRRLAPLLNDAHHALIGVNTPSWRQAKSRLTAAMLAAGVKVMPSRYVEGWSTEWSALAELLPRPTKYGLCRFLSHCTSQGVGPDEVGENTFVEFHRALTTESLLADPEAVYRIAVNAWNSASDTFEGWPGTKAPALSDGRRAAVPITAFPESYRQDVEGYLNDAGNPNVFAEDYREPLRAATICSRRKNLHHAARLLHAAGTPTEEITGLSVLVAVANVEIILQRLLDQNGGEIRPGIGVLAAALHAVALRWVKPPPADLERLKAFAVNCTPKRNGMTEKNKARIDQFDLVKNVDALLALPRRTATMVVKKGAKPTYADAAKMARALAVETLTVCPMRLSNLVGLRLDCHLKTVGAGRNKVVRIVIPREETKTNVVFDAPLPDSTVKLLDLYLKQYRPLIAGGQGPYLFPGRGGNRRADTRFGQSLSEYIYRETGLELNPHIFRHFAAYLYLRDNPDGIEVVRRLLGHSSSRTTLKFYAMLESRGAFERYDALIADRRSGTYAAKRGLRTRSN